MAEAWAKQLERESIREQALKDQKELLEYQYKLEAERQQRAMRLEAEQRESARRAEAARMEEQRRQQRLAEEKKAQEEATQRRNAISTGTGFFIAPNGYLITNHHVVEDKTHYAVRDQQGNFYKAEIVAQDPNRDLAILRVAGSFPSLRIARSETVTKGQRVMTVGYPQVSIQGNESKVTDGVISSFSGVNNDANWFQISTPIQGGNSGGPLVTETGQVVGVVVATANAMRFFKNTGNIPQNVNYAIKSNVLLGFLTEQNIANTAAATNKITIEAVDRATVLVISKNSPIEVNYSVSPEAKARIEQTRKAEELETARQQKESAKAETARMREVARLAARLELEEKVAERRRIESERIVEKKRIEDERLEGIRVAKQEKALRERDRMVESAVPEWSSIKDSEYFSIWLAQQDADTIARGNSLKAQDVIPVANRYQNEYPDFLAKQKIAEKEKQFLIGKSSFQSKQYGAALAALLPFAEGGRIEASAIVSSIYLNNVAGTTDDYRKADRFAKGAENLMEPNDLFKLARMIRQGSLVPEDLERAFTYYSLAAAKGHDSSKNDLANMYRYGLYVKRDPEKAFVMFKELGLRGVTTAEFVLGMMYLAGDGTKKDERLGVIWVQAAAEKGDKEAIDLLALYKSGRLDTRQLIPKADVKP